MIRIIKSTLLLTLMSSSCFFMFKSSGPQVGYNKTEQILKAARHNVTILQPFGFNQTGHSDISKCQDVRLSHLRSACQKFNLGRDITALSKEEWNRTLARYLTDDFHQVIVTAFPKTGSTTLLDVMKVHSPYFQTGNQNCTENYKGWDQLQYCYHLPRLKSLERQDIFQKLQTHFLIMTVRHPLTRLESGFRDRIIKYKKTLPVYNATLFQRFQEFLDGLLLEDESQMDDHFKPISVQTMPCTVPKSYIAKTETLDSDLQYILKERLRSKKEPIHLNPSMLEDKGDTDDDGKELRLFSGLKDPKQTINKLMTKGYNYDMELFGYTYKVEGGKVIAMSNDCDICK